MCITKYRLFTGDQWLPEEPQFCSGGGSISSLLLDAVNIEGYFGVKGGESEFVSEFLAIPADLKLADSNAKHKAVLAEVNTNYFSRFVCFFSFASSHAMLLQQFQRVKVMIAEDLATSMSDMFGRMSEQEDGIFGTPFAGSPLRVHTQQQAVHTAMKICSRKSTHRGFLVWLSPSVVNTTLYVRLFCQYATF